jgi:hypothetical protein
MSRPFAAFLAVLLFSLPAFNLAATAQTAKPASAAQPGPDDRARQWLTLVDDSNYAESAKQMGPQARKADIDKLPSIREPLGAMSSRSLKDVTLTRTSAGMPAGQYAVVRYESNFARKAVAMETITLAMTKTGWAVVGYRID